MVSNKIPFAKLIYQLTDSCLRFWRDIFCGTYCEHILWFYQSKILSPENHDLGQITYLCLTTETVSLATLRQRAFPAFSSPIQTVPKPEKCIIQMYTK